MTEGERYGRLVIVSLLRNKTGHKAARCICDCGATTITVLRYLNDGRTRSCGCLLREWRSAKNFKHGASEDGRTPEYGTWCSMRARCLCPTSKSFKNYGGRGIKICDRWLSSFQLFLDDMGKRPSPELSIERIDVNGNYEPSNCRWASPVDQCRNKRTTKLSIETAAKIREMVAAGVPKTHISRLLGVHYSSVKQVAYGHQWRPATPLYQSLVRG